MEIKFVRQEGNLDLPAPTYATSGSAGFDLRAFIPEGHMDLEAGQKAFLSIGFKIQLPTDYEMQIRPRSSIATKHDICIPNSPCTIDSDYRNVVMVCLRNDGRAPFRVSHGDRIAQGVLAKVYRADWVEVEELSDTERGDGGFGSTGRS